MSDKEPTYCTLPHGTCLCFLIGDSSRDQDLLATEPPTQLSTKTAARDGGSRGNGRRTAGGSRPQRGDGRRWPIVLSAAGKDRCK